MEELTIKGSKKRQLLALYLDFILFMVVWGLLEHFVAQENGFPSWVALITFGMVKVATHKLLGSPGAFMLSIGRDGLVNPEIHARENWLTILLGVLFVLEGTKQLVRWTQLLVPEPFFGFIPSSNVQILINITIGTLFVIIGYLFLKLHRTGLILGLIAGAAAIVSCVLSWSLWDKTVAEMVVARRALQGKPVGENEVEFMQLLMPEGILLLAVVLCLAMILTYRRFALPNNSFEPTSEPAHASSEATQGRR